MKAVRFVFLSNYTLFGKMGTLNSSVNSNHKSLYLVDLKHIQSHIKNTHFFNHDFRDFLRIIAIEECSTFIYADPPYITTNANYTGFTEQDSLDLFDSLEAKKCKWAMSEFDNPFILNQAKDRGLNVIIIGERRNINNRRTEILVTNYKTPNKSLI
jgi:DNA adenine methylase